MCQRDITALMCVEMAGNHMGCTGMLSELSGSSAAV